MKQLLIAATLLATTIGTSFGQDFRGFAWGNTLKTVQSSEKSPLLAKIGNDELSYKDIIGGSDCDVFYIFNDNDKLTSGLYVFTKVYRNPQLYIQDYNKFKSLLTEKYGKPTTEKENWSPETSGIDKQNLGQALLDGHLSFATSWNLDRTIVKILLNNTDKHPVLEIIYTTSSLDELENKEELQQALKKL